MSGGKTKNTENLITEWPPSNAVYTLLQSPVTYPRLLLLWASLDSWCTVGHTFMPRAPLFRYSSGLFLSLPWYFANCQPANCHFLMQPVKEIISFNLFLGFLSQSCHAGWVLITQPHAADVEVADQLQKAYLWSVKWRLHLSDLFKLSLNWICFQKVVLLCQIWTGWGRSFVFHSWELMSTTWIGWVAMPAGLGQGRLTPQAS